MRLQKLTIKNIASIENAVIDFENGPLGEESLFLICGETGSGKTTILDSICLALYNETPRMERSENESYKTTGEIYASAKKDGTIAINDSRQMMRRNSGEAWSEVEFIGSNEMAYTARWYVARAHKKLTGTIQKEIWTLENRTTSTQIVKSGEIKAEIQDAIGLTFEQFCRTTMLAQGEFTKFLHSKEGEKSDILEKLTGTGIYSEIGAEIFKITKEKRLDYEEQKRKTENINILNDEEISDITESIAQKTAEVQNDNKGKESSAHKLTWLLQLKELASRKTSQKTQWEQKRAEIETEEFQSAERLISEWQISSVAIEQTQQLNQLNLRLQSDNTKETELRQQFNTLDNGYKWLSELVENQNATLVEIAAFLKDKETVAPILEQSGSIITDIKTFLSSQKKIRQHTEESENLLKEEPDLKRQYQGQTKAFNAQEEANKLKQQEIDSNTKQFELMNINGLNREKETLEKQKETLIAARSSLLLLSEHHNIAEKARQKENEYGRLLEECIKKNTTLQNDYEIKRTAYTEAETIYDKQRESIQEWAKEARDKLTAGDMCPVCGQIIDVLPEENEFKSILAPVYENLEVKRNEFNDAGQSLKANSELQKSYQTSLENLKRETINAQSVYDKTLADTREKCELCDIRTIDNQTHESLNDRIKTNAEQTDGINGKLSEAQALSRFIAKLQSQKNDLQKAVETAHKELIATERKSDELRNKISTTKALINKENELSATITERVSGILAGTDRFPEWTTAPDSFMEQLQNETTEYRSAQNKCNELKTNMSLHKQELKNISATRSSICAIFPAWDTTSKAERPQTAELGTKWNLLYAQVNRLIQSINHTKESIKELTNNLSAFYMRNPNLNATLIERLSSISQDDIEQSLKRQQETKEEEIALRTAYEMASLQEQQHLERKPQLSESENEDALRETITETDKRITENNQNIGLLKARLEQNSKNEESAKQEKQTLDKLREIYIKWDRLCRYFGDEKGKTFRNIAQSFVLKELLHGANFYLHKFTERYELACQAGSLTILIYDHYQGDVCRPASTLSGGESFIVSLSLALGLSSLSKNSLSVDTLFIDEGFGTLSSDYLNVVMDTLEKLRQMGGKKVGIISHVEELRERIKTQIQVTRIDNSRSQIQTVSIT